MPAKYHRSEPGNDGPSWLTFIDHVKDSVWRVDLFRRDSILLRSHLVILVRMYSRAGSSVSASIPNVLMVSRYAGCSITSPATPIRIA